MISVLIVISFVIGFAVGYITGYTRARRQYWSAFVVGEHYGKTRERRRRILQ